MNWLLLFVPVAIGLEVLAPDRHLLVFVTSALALLPLAAWLGWATEQLAERMGEGIGGLLNATFGNAAELIIAFVALRAGLHDVVEASIAGSIVGNMLLVLGAAMLAGGLCHPEQHFNPAGARSQATMLTLAAIALILPAAFEAEAGMNAKSLGRLSISLSVVLLLTYVLFLTFTLVTHATLFAGSAAEEEKAPASVGRAMLVLGASIVGIDGMSEILVAAIEPTTYEFGFSKVFVAVFVVAILGNAAGHANGCQRSAEGPDGPLAFDRDRFERASGALRGPGPGTRELFCGSYPDGSGLPCWPRSDRLSCRSDHRPGGERRSVRLAKGHATSCRLSRPRSYVLFPSERDVSLTMHSGKPVARLRLSDF